MTITCQRERRATGEHRGFSLIMYRSRISGTWDGMAKGRGTVVLAGYGPHATVSEVAANLAARLDILLARGQGVFADA